MNNNEVRLIDANELIKNYLNHCRTEFEVKNKCMADENVIAIIDNAPTADDWEQYSTKLWKEAYEQGKADRPQGEWTVIGLVGDYAFCKCSECGNITRLYRDSKNEFCCIADIRNKVIACLYCGADMRKGGADNDT